MRSRFLGVTLLVLVAMAAHAPSLHNGFIWDDDDHLTQNPAVAAPDGLRRIWSSLATARYYPLTLSVFWLERQAWDLSPMPYHAVNLLLHASSAVILFSLLRRLAVPGAWAVAALWAVHPVNVESVAWVTEMKNTLSGVFFLLTLLSFVRYDEERKNGWYALALTAFAAALVSKPSTVPLPAVLMTYTWWRRGRWRRADVLRMLPFVVLSIAMATVTMAEQRLNVQLEALAEWRLPSAVRLVVAGKALWFYLGKLVWPTQLSFVYPRWFVQATEPTFWIPLGAVLVVAVALVACRRRDWARASMLGLGYFVLMTAPVLGLVDVYYFRYSFVADHFIYLSSIGPIALIVAGIMRWARPPVLQRLVVAFALIGLGWTSWQRAPVFRDDESLWRDTLVKNPEAVLAHNNLGNIKRRAGNLMEAEFHYRKALQLSPDYAQIHNNLGTVLADLGRRAEAAGEFETALQLRPGFPAAHENLARLLAEAGRDDGAIQHLRAAASAEAYLPLGELLQRRGRYAEADRTYRDGMAVMPDNLHLANEHAWLLATCPDPKVRRPAEALRVAERICAQTHRQVPEVLNTLAAAQAASGQNTDAARTAREAADLAERQGRSNLVVTIKSRLATYESAFRP